MILTVDYYMAPHSPWAYLGHARFAGLLQAAGAAVRLRPVDLGGKVFPASGGLPLAKRAPQRQAYRLVELRRYSTWLGLPLNPQPRYFPVASDDAARLIIVADQQAGTDAAMRLSGAVMRAVWAEERDIANAATLAELLAEQGLPAGLLAASQAPAVNQAYEGYTEQALAAGVFGAPAYVIEGEMFWGQDRLDFVERRLAAGAV
ncbi:MAG TPA: 2-hydroxychromene-2-carboxylate isomerase [Ideonella sp.]|nr:2-hydroxychromene-2-carboxylate isomerase [Ideonella sp.]